MQNFEQQAFVKVKLVSSEQYGSNEKGVFLCENVKKGTKLWSRMTADKSIFTREELERLKLSNPELSHNIDSFSCQSGHDIFTIPTSCLQLGENIDFRQYVNHSCDPNCGYLTENNQTFTIALRDINAEEELRIHYGMLETEISFTNGLLCRCGATNCQKIWTLDLYRTKSDLLNYAKPELVNQIKELTTIFWYSPKCWLKRIEPADDEYSIPIKDRELSLFTRQNIESERTLVAKFLDGNHHYIRRVDFDPNCLLDGNNVISKRSIEKDEEITIAK